MSNLSKQEALSELWRRGILSWKLDSVQKDLYKLFYNSENKIQCWLLSRRFGKTRTLIVLALEQCIRVPNSIVKFVSPTKLQVNNNVRPLIRELLEDCPNDIKPEFRSKDYIYYFSNGSEIQLAGTDNGHAEKLRGGNSHIAIIDEAGSCSDLTNIIRSILLPTTLITKGKVLLAGTPPKHYEHDFNTFVEECEARDTLIKKTIYDNPRLTQKDIEDTISEYGGAQSEEFRREYLCEPIKDSKFSAIPEFTPELEKEIVKEWPKPPFYDAYEAMDLGFKDLTVLLYGYYDFRADKVIIEDEQVIDGSKLQLPTLVEDIKKKEQQLWYNPYTNEVKKPVIRVSDINYIVTSEISRISHGEINFVIPKKDDKGAAVNTLRAMLGGHKIIINPRCKTLIRHLNNVRWKKSEGNSVFARSVDNGHYDAVDALTYFIRTINYSKNPYPIGYGINTKDIFIKDKSGFTKNSPIAVYKKIFNIKDK